MIKTDILIIGLGLAGITAAITAAKSGKKIIILTKTKNLSSGSTPWAQGGIVYKGLEDSPKKLKEDIEYYQKNVEEETNVIDEWLYELNISESPNRNVIKKAKSIANPGCFATAIQLALLPLAKENKLNSTIHINATTGSTGAGVENSSTSHFSWRNHCKCCEDA